MNLSLYNRIKGGIFGLAVGDALGGTTEFMTKRENEAKHGYLTEMIGGGVWNLEPGEVTDDTRMTICVAEGILQQPEAPMNAIGEKFLTWYHSKPKDIGNIIRAVFQSYAGDWFEAAIRVHERMGQSAGNGTLMRCLPAGLCYSDLADIEKMSRMQSRMTHYDNRCDEACIIYNRIVYRVLNDENLRDAIEAEVKPTAYAGILMGEPDCEPSGFVVDTFRWVIHLLWHAGSFEEVVQQAANAGGDSDTIGAIAGGLAGVYYGFDSIPERYKSSILIRSQLDDVCTRIYEFRESLI
ncbi:ADP-ribosylglycohydrolase family protein [Paenibacillus solisilvae]|uniref:ADP-ribosylglycohydrolase family protein n=1 Tax=Paenibacillus solisilvae TaxID=2486751 RepID=A0ABW0VX04_9BACL